MSDVLTQAEQTAQSVMATFAAKATPHTEQEKDRLEGAIEWQSMVEPNDWGLIQAKGIEFSFAVPLEQWPDIITEDINRAIEDVADAVAKQNVEDLSDVGDVSEMDAGANAYARLKYDHGTETREPSIVVIFQLDIDTRFSRA